MFSIVLLIITTGIVLDGVNAANEYWCYRNKYCRGPHEVVCARDVRLNQVQWFPDDCAVFNYNCKNNTDFTVTNAMLCNTLIPTTATTTTSAAQRRRRIRRNKRANSPIF